MGKGNLVQAPFSEINATLEILDRYDVTPRDFGVLRSASSWSQIVTARILKCDKTLWALLAMEARAATLGFTESDYQSLTASEEKLRAILALARSEQYGSDCMIDLSTPAKLPFVGAVLDLHRGEGIVKLEKRGDDLYLDGKKLVLYCSKRQLGGKYVVGHELRKEREKLGNNIPAVVLDYLVAHPEMWPESWKKDEKGNTLYIFFWNDIFRDPSSGDLYVRYGFWGEGGVVSSYNWLGNDWDSSFPAAVLAS